MDGWIMRYSGLGYNCQASTVNVETGKNGAPLQSTSGRETALEEEEELNAHILTLTYRSTV